MMGETALWNVRRVRKHASGGIAIDHIATPAVPPATMTAPRFNSEGDVPIGVKAFFVTSYAAKYLRREYFNPE